MKMSEQKTYTGEALYAMNSNHMLKSILNLRSVLVHIPILSLYVYKAAINMHLFYLFIYLYVWLYKS
jgi:hypothetical protein